MDTDNLRLILEAAEGADIALALLLSEPGIDGETIAVGLMQAKSELSA